MFYRMTELKINEAVVLELNNACKVHGAAFHSLHEGYAVLEEEREEAEQNADYIRNHMTQMWDAIKVNDEAEAKANARLIAINAVELAKEACQIAAVARKVLGENNYEGKKN